MIAIDQKHSIEAIAQENWRRWRLDDLVLELQHNKALYEQAEDEEHQYYLECVCQGIMADLKRRREISGEGSQDVREAIKQRAHLPDVAEWYVQVWYVNRNWKFRCTRHGNDRNPSGVIFPDGHYYCFGCNEGGDVYNFVQRYGNQTFRQALQTLAKFYGFDLQQKRKRGGVSFD